MRLLKIIQADGQIVGEIVNPELVKVFNHQVAIHPSLDANKPNIVCVAEIETGLGLSIAEGPSRDEAIANAESRLRSFFPDAEDPVATAIASLAASNIESFLTAIVKAIKTKPKGKVVDDDDDEDA